MPQILKAIMFKCENCDQENYYKYTLESGIYKDRRVMKDRIDCAKCGFENFVYDEIDKNPEYPLKNMIRDISIRDRYIVCAAIRHKAGGGIICGPRHFDSIMGNQIRNNAYKGWSDAEQGFVDQYGTFIDRKEALIIAKKKNQVVRKVGGDSEELFSENLY